LASYLAADFFDEVCVAKVSELAEFLRFVNTLILVVFFFLEQAISTSSFF